MHQDNTTTSLERTPLQSTTQMNFNRSPVAPHAGCAIDTTHNNECADLPATRQYVTQKRKNPSRFT